MHYNGPVVRPPHEAFSVLLETTIGCTHNSCTFCTFYKGFPFRLAPLDQMETDLQEAKRTRPNEDHVWLSGGDPFTMNMKWLETWANLVHKYYPDAYLATYARIDSTFHKSAEDMRRLHDLGYDDIVIGIESGWDDVLAHVNKGYTQADILRECRKYEEAGIRYRVIYLSGLAGSGKGEKNARITAQVLNQLHPTFMYLTSVTVVHDSALYQEVKAGTFKEATELDRIKEFRALIAGLENPIEVDANNISNPVAFFADLPAEKGRALKALDRCIEHWSARDERRRREQREAQLYI